MLGKRTVSEKKPFKNKVMENEIKDSIKSLSLKLREVLILVALENKSYKETAEILNIPIGTVMSRLNEARKKLSFKRNDLKSMEVN